MAKLARESRLRERRQEKQAKRDARKLAAHDPDHPGDALIATTDEPAPTGDGDHETSPDLAIEIPQP